MSVGPSECCELVRYSLSAWPALASTAFMLTPDVCMCGWLSEIICAASPSLRNDSTSSTRGRNERTTSRTVAAPPPSPAPPPPSPSPTRITWA